MNKRFRRVAVLKGGVSREREVSLRSGAAVAGGLRAAGYDVAEIDVRDRELHLPAGIEAVFIVLHGDYGEDGAVQRQLEERGIPFTGSGSRSSARTFDKLASKQLFVRERIPTPDYEVLGPGGRRSMPLPVVVKPVRQGSSLGVHRVFDEAEWPSAFEESLGYEGQVIVETFIPGRELTVGIVGDQVLPMIEIRAPEGYYDYKAKYTAGVTEYLVPAPVDAGATLLCMDLARRTFNALEGRGMGRVDLRMSDDGRAYVLELNSIPGFTETSLLPKAARAAGIAFPELCERILNMA